MSTRTVHGFVTSNTENVRTSMVLHGTRVVEMSYTFDREVSSEEVLSQSFLRSFLGCGLFEGPTMSADNRTATFYRRFSEDENV